jgi:hypothetical protein
MRARYFCRFHPRNRWLSFFAFFVAFLWQLTWFNRECTQMDANAISLHFSYLIGRVESGHAWLCFATKRWLSMKNAG